MNFTIDARCRRALRLGAWLAVMTTLGCHAREVEPTAHEATSTLEGDPDDPDAGPPAILREGAIATIQAALRERGYAVTQTGKLDEATTDALLAFQAAEDLARTGFPDHETMRRLGLDSEEWFVARDDAKSPDEG
jgi:peptidoglycan hydrolase-like protein with peptidoglycan-binding domain